MMGFSTLMLDADGVVRADGEIKQNEHRLYPTGVNGLVLDAILQSDDFSYHQSWIWVMKYYQQDEGITYLRRTWMSSSSAP